MQLLIMQVKFSKKKGTLLVLTNRKQCYIERRNFAYFLDEPYG